MVSYSHRTSALQSHFNDRKLARHREVAEEPVSAPPSTYRFSNYLITEPLCRVNDSQIEQENRNLKLLHWVLPISDVVQKQGFYRRTSSAGNRFQSERDILVR